MMPKRPTECDPEAALALYRWRAWSYDWQLAPYEPIRRHAVARLGLKPGQTVLDIGCGTGMSLPLLRDAVGEAGQVIGVDQSPDMTAVAHDRICKEGWGNVSLICAPIAEAPLPEFVDAVLFHFTHDILQSDQALDRVFAALKPDAHVSATGLQWTTPMWPGLNGLVWLSALQSITTLQHLDAPWLPLLQRGVKLDIETAVMGTIYMASGARTA